ncbi:MAG TPA: MmgE/PrpD family protein, partial [Candidatus Dormibacteraeota bacterium]
MKREPTLTQSLAGFVADLRREQVPEPVMEDAVRRVVDAVGVGLAGSTSPYASMALEVAGEYRGRPEATALGSGRRLPAPLAAMVNAALVHGHDFDDMHSRAMVHISCVTVPAAIALAEQRGATGADCLLALVAGAEVGLRLGDAAPHRFILRGWHGTSVCGTFAAAAVTAKLVGLDATRTAHALGLAAS